MQARSDRSDNALIIFVRNPEAGKVKTRLAASVGDARALEVYERLLEHVRSVTEPVNADRFLFYSEYVVRGDRFDDGLYRKYVQREGDLGERMAFAFSIPFKNAYERVVIVGSDVPGISTEHIEEAIAKLAEYDAVIGPAHDGGYWLLGLRKPRPELFEEITWSSDRVFDQTMRKMEAAGLRVFRGPVLRDLDTAEDLEALGWSSGA